MKQKKPVPFSVACFILAAGVGLIIAGAARGEAEVVFEKAVRICMECIGIG